MLDIFEVINGQVVVRIPTVMLVKEFAAVWGRVRKTEKDFDGRKKRINTLEMGFVVCMGDNLLTNNLYSGFLPKERVEKIKADIGLPEDWKPDAEVKAAIEKYIEIQTTYVPSAAALASVERGIKLAGAAVDSYVEQLYDSIQGAREIVKNTVGAMTQEDAAKLAIKNDAIYVSLKRILELSKGLPQSIVSINHLRNEVSKELRNMPKKASGRKIGRYEDPNQNIAQ